jgi:hypothetical protein
MKLSGITRTVFQIFILSDKGLYYLDTKDGQDDVVMINTVEGNSDKYSQCDCRQSEDQTLIYLFQLSTTICSKTFQSLELILLQQSEFLVMMLDH